MIKYFFYLALYAALATKYLFHRHTDKHLGIETVYPNDQNPENFVLFHLLPSVPGTAYGKSLELRVRGLEVKWGWANKTNFSLFLCFVCEVFLAAWSNVDGSFHGKVRVFRFICWCNVSSLYFLHKLLNETAYLICARWRVPGWGSRPFLCPLQWGINWQVRNKW